MLGGVPDLVLGAAVGAIVSAVYDDLYNLTKHAVARTAWCKKYCKELAKDLELLQPVIIDICSVVDQNPQLQRSWRQPLIAFKDRLEEGKNLVTECLKLTRLDLFRRHRYGKSILELEKDITRFIQKLTAVNTEILLHQQISSRGHNDRLEEVNKTHQDLGQEYKQHLTELGQEQTKFAQDHGRHLQELSQEQKHNFEELAREHKLRSDEIKETVNLAIANMTKEGTNSTAIASSLQQLGRLVMDLRPSVQGQQAATGLEEALTMPKFLVGLAQPLKEVKEQLISSKRSVMVVGMKGMGGVGKTTLASALCHDLDVQDFFKGGIHFVTVSQSPNLLELLKSLWEKLIGGLAPWFQNEEDAHRQLQGAINRLTSPVLVVLDDVWSRKHLENLIFEGEHFRIVFTTRQASTVPVKDTFLYELGLLGEEDALRLFCFWAFGQESIPEWHNALLVKEVQDECKRLPLALRVIGGSLCNQPEIAWRNARKRLRQAETIGDYHTEALLKRLQTSFDVLDVKLQQCFIDFGSFPEDNEIPAHLLFDMWIYVRGMDWDDAVMALAELTSRCLVDMTNNTFRATNILSYGSAIDIVCNQHDVMRDLALYLGRIAYLPNPISIELNHKDILPHLRKWLLMPQKERQIPDDWKSYDNNHFNAEIMSINTEAITKEDWPTGINFSAIQALLLYIDGDNYSLPPFIESMPTLKVLVIQSSTRCNVTGFEVLDNLTHLRSVYLQGFTNDYFVHCLTGFKSMKSMQKLYLVISQCDTLEGILSGPSCCLTDLTLRRCKGLKKLMMNGTYAIPSLKRVTLEGCSTLPVLPDNIGSNLANLEVLSLKSCRRLQSLPDSLCKLGQLQHLDLSYCESIEALPEDFGQLCNLKELKLIFCQKLRALPSSITQLHSLQLLLMAECQELESLPEDFGKLSNLNRLELHYNRKLRKLPSSIRELRALRTVTCDDKFLGEWEALKENHQSCLQVRPFKIVKVEDMVIDLT